MDNDDVDCSVVLLTKAPNAGALADDPLAAACSVPVGQCAAALRLRRRFRAVHVVAAIPLRPEQQAAKVKVYWTVHLGKVGAGGACRDCCRHG